jgi:hypothetical protein
MALSEADIQRARALAAAAPPLSAEQRDQIRAILTGCIPAQAPPSATAQRDPDHTADAA